MLEKTSLLLEKVISSNEVIYFLRNNRVFWGELINKWTMIYFETKLLTRLKGIVFVNELMNSLKRTNISERKTYVFKSD